ncbi:hypothetical protein D3C73_1304910 [compost metagenome]
MNISFLNGIVYTQVSLICVSPGDIVAYPSRFIGTYQPSDCIISCDQLVTCKSHLSNIIGSLRKIIKHVTHADASDAKSGGQIFQAIIGNEITVFNIPIR